MWRVLAGRRARQEEIPKETDKATDEARRRGNIATGKVQFSSMERGYGFIKPDDGGRSVFVHITALERAGLKKPIKGQQVWFDNESDKKARGPKAINLHVPN
jgi:CspA family cold shock protein